MPDLKFWAVATISVAALGQTLFALLYTTFPWWRNFLGRALFFKAVTFAVLFDLAVVSRYWDWEREAETFVVLYGVMALGIWLQFFAFLRVRMRGSQDRVSGNPEAMADAGVETETHAEVRERSGQ